ALFATSLNLLVGYTGLVSFGHAAYFGIGAYTTGILMKKLGVPFLLAFPAAGVLAGAFALLFGLFCVRLTRIYFAMLTLAFAQIVWAICFKWNEVTGGEQGMPEVPYPDLAGMGTFYGPSVGALALILLNQQIVSYTEYWPFVLGTILVVLLFGFPGGLGGALELLGRRLWRPRRA